MTRTKTSACVLLAAGVVLLPSSARAQSFGGPYPRDVEIEARVWLDRGSEPLFQRGETARLYYRSTEAAFVAIFQIDTNGAVRLIFPDSPDDPHFVRGGLDYRLLFPRSQFWQVQDDPGVGYFFMVASPEPFDFSSFGYSHFDRGWDLSRVTRDVYRDPHVAMDDFVAALIPVWQAVPYALDFVSYEVGARFEYPRFLCYDCHGFRPYAAWNPYLYACTSFRLVIFTDPYYYAATRYRGNRVVFARPPAPFEPRFGFKERASNEPSRPLLLDTQSRASTIRLVGRRPSGGTTTAPPAVPPQRGTSPTSGRQDPGIQAPQRGQPRGGSVEPSGQGGSGVTVPSGGQVRPGVSVPSGGQTRPPVTVPSGGQTRPPVTTPSGAGEARPSGGTPSVPSGGDRPTTGSPQDRLRPVLQPRPSSPPPAVPSAGSRPSSSGESSPPPRQAPPPEPRQAAPRPSPSTPPETPSTTRPPSSGTPAPVPVP